MAAQDGDVPGRARRPGGLAKAGAAAAAVLVFLLIVSFALPHLMTALDIDRCLDAGGRWDHAAQSCEGARP